MDGLRRVRLLTFAVFIVQTERLSSFSAVGGITRSLNFLLSCETFRLTSILNALYRSKKGAVENARENSCGSERKSKRLAGLW